MLSREWRCSWSSADRGCSNYFWVNSNFIAYWSASYIRDLTAYAGCVSLVLFMQPYPMTSRWLYIVASHDAAIALVMQFTSLVGLVLTLLTFLKERFKEILGCWWHNGQNMERDDVKNDDKITICRYVWLQCCLRIPLALWQLQQVLCQNYSLENVQKIQSLEFDLK